MAGKLDLPACAYCRQGAFPLPVTNYRSPLVASQIVETYVLSTAWPLSFFSLFYVLFPGGMAVKPQVQRTCSKRN